MPWVSPYSGNTNPIFHWNYSTSVTPNRLVRGTQSDAIKSTLEYRGDRLYDFKSNKTYIWKTYVRHFNSASQRDLFFEVGAIIVYDWHSRLWAGRNDRRF